MQRSAAYARDGETRTELVALLLASVACVVVLVVSIVEARSAGGGTEIPLAIIAIGVAAVALSGLIAFVIVRRSARLAAHASADAELLRTELFMAQSVFEAEPQILVFWEQDHGLRLVTHTLNTVAGVPSDQPTLLRFGRWLDTRSAGDLKSGLDRLFQDGRPFNFLLKTKVGGHVEADARAVGSRAVLRFRDIAGYKRDLVEVLEQHRHLTRDIKTSRALLNALPMPVWVRDPVDKLEWVNAAYVAAVDASHPKDVVEEQIELLDARQRAVVKGGTERPEASKKRLQLLVEGTLKTHDVISVPVDDSRAVAAIDVTELETARGELRRQEMAYDRTLDRVSTAVALFNTDRKLAFYNEAYRELWELDPNWLDQQPTDGQVLDRLRELSRLPSTGDYRQWKNEIVEVNSTKQIYEDHWALPDGRILRVFAEQRPDGGITYLFDDRSEQLALESRYRTMIQVQRETLDSLKEAVAVFGTNARLRLFNSAFAQIWRLSESALAQRPHIDEFISSITPQCDDAQAWAPITAAVTSLSGDQKSIDGQLRHVDGAIVDFATTPLPDGGTLVTFVDVTTTQNYQRALLERNEALVAADRLKSRFISHVSYELRTPLTNIIGFSELLESPRTGELNTKQREYLSDISASSRTLLAIIDDILDLTSIDAGSLELHYDTVIVREVIDAAVRAVADRASRARITLDVGVADDVTHFLADPQRIRQILYNLLSNAVGFSKAGDVVRLSCWQEYGHIVFEIVDQGIGIPKADQVDVFERFVSRSQGSKHRGAGLGLSIVKSIVEHQNGTIALSSEPDEGTTVTVRLPLQPSESLQSDSPEARLTQRSA
ncbi:MAG: ATP-binding protein [Pseudomonadota bacterium]